MTNADIELLQFRYSPYNEKARWALDLKRVPHRRRSLLPGPHMIGVRRRTGQTQTPILRLDGRWIAGSAAIVAALDARFPVPRLTPDGEADQREARDIERQFDDDWVPRMRRPVLAALLGDGAYLCRLFGEARGAVALALYRATFPAAKGLIAKGNGIQGPASIEDGLVACGEALDFAARRAAATGYLVGSRFSTADLAAAAGLAPIVDPPASPMQRPTPRPAALEALFERWRAHPGAVWVRSIYAQHRQCAADFEGPSP
jgi:glutathione S-transferase